MNRRTFLAGSFALASCGPTRGTFRFRHAVCNGTWPGVPFEEICRDARAAGYEALEIAPATVEGRKPADLAAAMRHEGLDCVGLHALLAGSEFHATTSDLALRTRTWERLRRLTDFAAEIGGRLAVLGSGKQRSSIGGSTLAEARDRLVEGLASLSGRGVDILLEPLKRPFSDVAVTLAESIDLVRRVGRSDIATMLDCRHSSGEAEDVGALVRRHSSWIRHVHVNEVDGRRPGTGSFDYGRLFNALREVDYRGWVSLEVFDFSEGGPRIARESISHLRRFE
jgi:sugar phosphate isomerase/epimerase